VRVIPTDERKVSETSFNYQMAKAGSRARATVFRVYRITVSYGLDPAVKPTRLDISETVRWLGYKPIYSLATLLSELAAYGDSGPPRESMI
jgi:hypothetical protein